MYKCERYGRIVRNDAELAAVIVDRSVEGCLARVVQTPIPVAEGELGYDGAESMGWHLLPVAVVRDADGDLEELLVMYVLEGDGRAGLVPTVRLRLQPFVQAPLQLVKLFERCPPQNIQCHIFSGFLKKR